MGLPSMIYVHYHILLVLYQSLADHALRDVLKQHLLHRPDVGLFLFHVFPLRNQLGFVRLWPLVCMQLLLRQGLPLFGERPFSVPYVLDEPKCGPEGKPVVRILRVVVAP